MRGKPVCLRDLTAEEAATVESLARSRTAPVRRVERARIAWRASRGETPPPQAFQPLRSRNLGRLRPPLPRRLGWTRRRCAGAFAGSTPKGLAALRTITARGVRRPTRPMRLPR